MQNNMGCAKILNGSSVLESKAKDILPFFLRMVLIISHANLPSFSGCTKDSPFGQRIYLRSLKISALNMFIVSYNVCSIFINISLCQTIDIAASKFNPRK